ncbi:hypothetical protein QWY86_15635 [Pedobacter aquatilis]|uniref:hypothetical protein n=1 Tax=Pedobacter aquatilis TaxID=351343 RepID=UPI0025B3FD50|nr:hypothetical protein [Pedobacter aquatilis]MDN3588115.1 hypothetical protein [Pedobacter aquatilis]
MQGWVPGNGSTGMFNQNGSTPENTREWGDGPNGKRGILWKASPVGDAHDDGGWNTNTFPINNQLMYRFSVWLKKTNSNSGNSYLGCQAVLQLDNTPDNNPYFFVGKLPALDKWYLVVGYIHGSGDASTVHYGGVYDGQTGQKVQSLIDFKFGPNDAVGQQRAYLFYDPNINDRQYFYAPRVEAVNGNEPSIASLLGIQGIAVEQGYFAGKVGIKTMNPGDYDLAVNGKIRTQEVKVEASNWPDYVFKEGYNPMPLQAIEDYIKLHHHLPEMPDAINIEKEGVELGQLNKLLLKKIEEITLHLIEIKKENKTLAEKLYQFEHKSKRGRK